MNVLRETWATILRDTNQEESKIWMYGVVKHFKPLERPIVTKKRNSPDLDSDSEPIEDLTRPKRSARRNPGGIISPELTRAVTFQARDNLPPLLSSTRSSRSVSPASKDEPSPYMYSPKPAPTVYEKPFEASTLAYAYPMLNYPTQCVVMDDLSPELEMAHFLTSLREGHSTWKIRSLT